MGKVRGVRFCSIQFSEVDNTSGDGFYTRGLTRSIIIEEGVVRFHPLFCISAYFFSLNLLMKMLMNRCI